MLMQKIRDWTAGWVAGVILGLIIITFAVWGINFSDQQQAVVVASVNGKDIELRRFQQAYNNAYEQMREYTGKPVSSGEQDRLKERVLDRLVQNELMYQIATEQGIHINDKKLRQVVKDIPAFNNEIDFDFDLYQVIVNRQLNISTAVFEDQLRSELMVNQLQRVIEGSVFVTVAEATQLTKINKQARNLHYVLLTADDLKNSMMVDEDSIEDFYNKTSDGLLTPEKIKIAYLELSSDELADEMVVSEEDLQFYYQENRDNYDQEEQRQLGMVDIKLAPDATAEGVSVATAKAEEIRASIASGSSFEDITKQYSDTSEVEILVTEHGYLSQGDLSAEISTAVFSSDEGVLSEIERTDQGLHIFQVSSIKDSTNTFAQAQEIVENDYKQEQAKQIFFDLSDKLGNLTYEHPDTLEVAAEVIGIDVQESNFFSREDADGLLANPKVLAVGFSIEAIESGQNSDVIQINDNHLFVMRVLEHLPAKKKELVEVEEQIIETLKFAQASEIQHERGEDILSHLSSSDRGLEQIAEKLYFQWTQVQSAKRDDVSVNRKILREAFKLDKPVDGTFTFGGTDVGEGDYAVFAITGVSYPDTLGDEDIEQSEATLRQLHAANEWQSVVDELMDIANISINSNF